MIQYVVMAWLLAAPAPAQIAPTSPGHQRAANRQALRDARRAEAPYKVSHLDVTRQQLRRGGSATPARPADAPRYGRDGRPRVPLAQRLGLRRPQTEPNP